VKLCLIVSVVALLAGCPTPAPVPPTPDADAAPLPTDATPPVIGDAGPIVTDVCAAYRRFMCLEGGPKCEQAINKVITKNQFPLDTTCIVGAKSLTALRACAGAGCETLTP